MRVILFVVILLCSALSIASDNIVQEPDGNSYSLVSHYRINIGTPTQTVWSHLKNLGSWMYDFEMAHESGAPGEVGEVLRLYPGQEFFSQITSVVPNELLVVANLPVTFKGEKSTGIAVITLNEKEDETIVDLTMSRRYTWQGEGTNPMKATRESPEFSEKSRAMWNRFLGRLRTLSEEN